MRLTIRHLVAVASATALAAAPGGAQLPGLPVFQGAFPTSGLAAGMNVGRSSGRTMVAGAVGYGPRSGRFALTAGIGAFANALEGYRGSRLAFGGRAAFTALRLADGRIAVTPFAGFGSSRATVVTPALTGLPVAPADTGTAIQFVELPLGAAVGWRFALGTQRAVALSLAPMYALYRRSGAGTDDRSGAMRLAAVADVAVTPRIGVTLAGEFGQAASGTEPGPRAARIGLGASFAFAQR